MANRYSRSEKEKWIAGPSRSSRRSPVRIPECDNRSLIEDNKLTLIGRVTNQYVQPPKAVVAFLPQLWKMESRVTGRELGADCFKFRFENEEDLQTVLEKAPFHYKKWMLLLQRWEPVVSTCFPSQISFWVRVHGIPLHYWNEQTLKTIGTELGSINEREAPLERDVLLGRIRVDINGLEPLEMRMPVRLPSDDITTVELEYENLGKHCFACLSLFHEEKQCSQKKRPHQLHHIVLVSRN